MREHVGLQISGLGESFVAVVKRTDVRPIASVDTDVCAEVKVQGESLTTTFKGTLQEQNEQFITTLTPNTIAYTCTLSAINLVDMHSVD